MSDAIGRRLRAVGEELAAALAATAGTAVAVAPNETPHQGGWRIVMTATGEPHGRLVLLLDGAAMAPLAARLVGEQGQTAATENAVPDLLRGVLSRAASAMTARDPEERLTLVVDSVEPAKEREAAPGDGVTLEFALNGLEGPVPVTLTWTHGAGADTAAGRGAASAAAATGRLDVILDIDLPVVVRFGCTQMPIRTLSRLGPGSVIELGRSPDDPVEVLVSNRVVARGEVVIVSGNYGVRILDVTSQSERARSMEDR